jgi:hypothetical protein
VRRNQFQNLRQSLIIRLVDSVNSASQPGFIGRIKFNDQHSPAGVAGCRHESAVRFGVDAGIATEQTAFYSRSVHRHCRSATTSGPVTRYVSRLSVTRTTITVVPGSSHAVARCCGQSSSAVALLWAIHNPQPNGPRDRFAQPTRLTINEIRAATPRRTRTTSTCKLTRMARLQADVDQIKRILAKLTINVSFLPVWHWPVSTQQSAVCSSRGGWPCCSNAFDRSFTCATLGSISISASLTARRQNGVRLPSRSQRDPTPGGLVCIDSLATPPRLSSSRWG